MFTRKSLGRFLSSLVLTTLSFASFAYAATLSGHVTDKSSAAVPQARVFIPALQKGALTGADGSYKIENLSPAVYSVELSRLGYATQIKSADVSKGDATLEVSLSASPLSGGAITITATSEARDALTTPASVSVVQGRQLDESRGQTVMSSVQNEPGVALIPQGPGIAKPVIRGLNGQDVVMVEDGVRSESLQWGREHAPEIDPLTTDRVEILRGPDSLIYGSDALGGVVSVSKLPLPSAALGDGPLSGKVVATANSVNNNLGQGVVLSGAEGDWGYRGTVSQQRAGDFRTPVGIVPNTGFNEASGDATFGVHKDWGTLSANYGHFSKQVQFQDDTGQDTEFQNLAHDKGYVRANIPTGLFRYDINVGYDHSNRQEFDSNGNPDPANGLFGSADPVLWWEQWNYTVDVKAHHGPIGPFTGTLGFSGLDHNEQSKGEAHLTPSYNENSGGVFAVEDMTLGPVTFSGGLRGDRSKYDIHQDDLVGQGTDNPAPVQKQTRAFSSLTGAIGGVWHVFEPFAFAVNVGRGFRNPTPFELFADGVHEGTGHLEIGDKNLKNETSLNTDVSLRYTSNHFRADWGFFRNRVNNFIFPAPIGTPDVTTGLPIFQTTQGDAVLEGTDLAMAADLAGWLTLNAGYDIVHGQNTTLDTPLPFVPANRIKTGVRIHGSLGGGKNAYLEPNAQFVGQQNRVADFETRTAGYTLLGVRVGGEIPVMGNRLALDAGVDNLTNKLYFDNLSLYKTEGIYQPGRNYFVRLSAFFGAS